MDRNLPATRSEGTLTTYEEREPEQRQPPVSVAYLPLALITFIILAFAIAAWTFLTAAY